VAFKIDGVTLPTILGTTGPYEIRIVDQRGIIKHFDKLVAGTNITNDRAPAFSETEYLFTFRASYVFEEEDAEPAFAAEAVGTITANDPDAGKSGEVRYTIVQGNVSSLFSLNSTSGVLSTKQYFGYEMGVRQYTMTVQAQDQAPPFRTANVTVRVNIINQNDHTPVLQFADVGAKNFAAELKETIQVGTVIANLVATDADEGVNGQLFYELIDGNGQGTFVVNPETGSVRVASTLDRSITAAYAIRIQVSDKALPASERRKTSAVLIVNVFSDDEIVYLTLDAAKAAVDSDVSAFQANLQAILCPDGECTIRIAEVEAVGEKSVVGFYAVLAQDAGGNAIINTETNSTVVTQKLRYFTSTEIEQRLLQDDVSSAISNGALGFPVDNIRAGTTEVDTPWYELAGGLLGQILVPIGIFFCLILPIVILTVRSCKKKHLRYTEKQSQPAPPAGWGMRRESKAKFQLPFAGGETSFEQDPLTVLYDQDRDYMGQSFENPLHGGGPVPQGQANWWDVTHEMEDNFLPAASIGMGLNVMSPGPSSGLVFDASAVDPTTGRTYFYNTETGERSWTNGNDGQEFDVGGDGASILRSSLW